ncbi:hypothetical protein GUITHDRAFT_109042 [Guillardia theta CCMP2712]|uniref:Uncharacterized protein n=1 Tax=Guillardia theta (strain CCMP2712) TaxID=905079 RepID=L1J8Z3_GUITC|nr:hypothetical protein GUITHDRAFT_109042 [Guillardia theta CCMP2712]EKX44996.1 hypothetical protein GUITHDRAFT_109042 [Guillardia theta CCMP2712]|eukprot:XP_005831976.1 hypothetical protein GUITHDRAFT_109042 [Guillardia theta CCMP2712]
MKSYLIFGVLLIVSQAVRGESQRISEFLEGSDGWRIFNALPDAGVAAGQVTVNSNNNPSYLILSNDVVFQLNAMKNVSSSLGLNMTIKIPQLCMAGDIDCKVILTLLGERCSISTQLAATSQVSSSLVDLLWYASAGRDVAASSWTVCSMLLAPYGYCTEQDAPSAMRAVMGTLRQVVLSVEVRCRYLCESMSFDFKLDSVAVAAQIEGNRMSSTRDRFPNIVGHLTLTSFPALSRCRDVRISSCIWDSCDASMQHLLEASCEGPYGMTGAHCWSQPFLMRYRLQMVGFKLQEATQTDIGCFQGSSCIEQIPLDVSNGVAISAEPMRSVWYWADDENGNVMYEGTSLLDRVEICNEHDLVSRKIENHTGDVVVVGRDGKCISFDYSDTPGEENQTARLGENVDKDEKRDEEEDGNLDGKDEDEDQERDGKDQDREKDQEKDGKDKDEDQEKDGKDEDEEPKRSIDADLLGPAGRERVMVGQIKSVLSSKASDRKSCGKTRTAAPSPDVVRVLGNPSWIFLRGAFYERRSNEDEDVRFDSGKGFLVGTRLGSVAILDSFINVKNVFPHLGPNSGGTRVVIEGEIAKMNANLKDYKCSWQFADKVKEKY